MKATIDIPDALYRQVKAKSALEGRAIREVASELFESYVASDSRSVSESNAADADPAALPSWFGLARRYLDPEASHDWSEIQEGIARGWAGAAPAPRQVRQRR